MPEWQANGGIELNRLYREGGASEVTDDIATVLVRSATGFEQFARDSKGSLAQGDWSTGRNVSAVPSPIALFHPFACTSR